MGAEALLFTQAFLRPASVSLAMLPPMMKAAAMKAKAAKAMTKTAFAAALAEKCELKRKVCTQLIGSLAKIATKEVSKTGSFSIPGLFKLKTRVKPATKAGKREIFGKTVMVRRSPRRRS